MESHALDQPLQIVKNNLKVVLKNYRTSVMTLKEKIIEIMVSAVIESQSLPNFITSERNSHHIKLHRLKNNPAFNINNLLGLLNSLFNTIKANYVEDSIIRRTIKKLLRLIRISAFSDLLNRRNFLS